MKNNKGFTLVELLAVIVILAIIMIISIPAVLDTMVSARKKTFGEYVTKVYTTAQNKYMNDELIGISKTYVKYDIEKDLDLGSTGNFKGYVAIYRNVGGLEIYVSLTDGEFKTATKYGDDDSMTVNYINYTLGGEPVFASQLNVYNGTKNYFTNGKIENFDLPDEPSPENENAPINIPISNDNYGSGGGTQTPEDKFVNGVTKFVSLAKSSFMTEINNPSSPYRLYYEENIDYTTGIPVTIKSFYYGYKINEISGSGFDPTGKQGYIIFFGDILSGTPLGKDLYMLQSYIAYKDENYHTILKVSGKNHEGTTVTETLPFIQLSENIDSQSLRLKKIDSLSTYNVVTEYKKNGINYNLDEAKASGDFVEEFYARGLTFNATMNSAHYYCSNSNPQCSLPDNYYDADYVSANEPFSTDINVE